VDSLPSLENKQNQKRCAIIVSVVFIDLTFATKFGKLPLDDKYTFPNNRKLGKEDNFECGYFETRFRKTPGALGRDRVPPGSLQG